MKQSLIAAAVLISCGALFLATRSAADGQPVFTRWEYAELVIKGDNATLTTETRLHDLEPPANIPPGSKPGATACRWGHAVTQAVLILV